MTAPPTTPVPAGDPATAPTTAVNAPRDPDLVLARVHLLLGSLSLARTELETLAGRGALDDGAIRDLAEARWRTGDAVGAGEAAAAWLEGHPDDVLGLVIAAEAQAALGRPGEARRLAGRAMERADGSLDPVFAGMQRSAIWPIEPGDVIGPAGVLFDDLHPGPHAVNPLPTAARGDARLGTFDRFDGDGSRDPGDRFEPGQGAGHAIGPSIWGDDAAAAVPAVDDAVDPATLFHQARGALEAGQAAEAATGLILALRASPGLAPAILDLLAGRSESILALVRGDAQRVVGREVEAMRDHAVAAGGVAGTDRVADAPTTSVLFPDDGALPDDAAGADEPATVVQDVPDEPTTPVQEDS
jgi:hypothetical protein